MRSAEVAGAVDPLAPLIDHIRIPLLREIEELRERLAELEDRTAVPQSVRLSDLDEWWERNQGCPMPFSDRTVREWWADRENNGAGSWGAQAVKGGTLIIDPVALIRWHRARGRR